MEGALSRRQETGATLPAWTIFRKVGTRLKGRTDKRKIPKLIEFPFGGVQLQGKRFFLLQNQRKEIENGLKAPLKIRT